MERNWDLIRKILLQCEKNRDPLGVTYQLPTVEESYEFRHQIKILLDVEYIEGRLFADSSATARVHRLTWSGHEFLDKIKDDTIWNKTKESFISKGLAMSFDLVMIVATNFARSVLGV